MSTPDLPPDASLETRQELFESAWRSWSPAASLPRWDEFLRPPGQSCTPDFVFLLVQTDIEFRIKGGYAALLEEPYFRHPRLQEADACLGAGRQVELIRWEYQQRWKRGARASRDEYLARFPEHTKALHDLRPRWNCSRCKHTGVPLEDEAASTVVCPRCRADYALDELFPLPLRETSAAASAFRETSAAAFAAEPDGLDPRRYELLDPLGEGGMGEVYRSRDPGLGRDLAIKVLRPKWRGDRQMEQRFRLEARITGSLQHPGIVPVHNHGRLPDGRLYFTMKLVRGKNFANILCAPGADSPERRPAHLGVFEKVCQALTYAHSRGVIHRDLKPSNVMVGAFGEVQVMDWGFAKVLDPARQERQPPEPEETSSIGYVRASKTGAWSQAGMVMGTYAFMAQEAARGEVDRLDKRCDVFGLGAILCVLLTGQPPYRGQSEDEVIRQATNAELADAFARLDGCQADAELVALAKRCLAAKREERLADAGAVAEAVAAYQAGVEARLRRAEVERAQADVRAKAERTRRRLAVALAAAVLLLAVGTLAAGLKYQWDRERRKATLERDVAVAVQEARTLGDQARAVRSNPSQWDALLTAARSAISSAEGFLARDDGLASPALRAEVQEVRSALDAEEEDRRMVAGVNHIMLRKAETDVKQNRFAVLEAVKAYRDEFAAYRLHVSELGPEQAAVRIRERPEFIRDWLVAALDDWMVLATHKKAVAEQDRLSAIVIGASANSALRQKEVAELDWLRAVVQSADPDPERNLVRQAGFGGNQQKLKELALTLKVAQHPPQISVQLGNYLGWFQAWPSVVGLLRRARQHYPDNFWINHNLGRAFTLMKPPNWDEAVRFYTAAVVLHPRSPAVHLNLGNALSEQGNLPEAVAAYEKAIELRRDYAAAHLHLGNALYAQNNLPGAVAAYLKAIDCKHDYAQAYCNVGGALRQQGEFVGALAAFKRGDKLVVEQGLRLLSAPEVRDCERLVELDSKLPAVLRGKVEPADADERADFARLCMYKQLHGVAARFYQQAFVDRSELADDLGSYRRYLAACAAALAAAGQGKDDPPLDEAARARWRQQAFAWLGADLALRAEQLARGKPADRARAREALEHWQQNKELAGLRDPAALAQLPVKDRETAHKLWADVAGQLYNAAAPK